MPVRELALRGFRSYAELDIRLEDGPHVVAGPNAAGKTNLIEALVVLSRGRSHRTGGDGDLVAWGADFARLEALVESGPGGPAGARRVEVVLGGAGSGVRKRILVNGVPRRATALAGALGTVVFAPEDMTLVVGAPGARRAAVDELVVQRFPGAAAAMSEYGRALAQRNALLRRIREASAGRDELAYWDGVLCESGGRVLGWRHDALVVLEGPLRDAHAAIAPREPDLGLRYASNALPTGTESYADALRRRLAETAEKELWNGATLVGPHRDDVIFEAGGRDLASYASRGQQRSAILALKLAVLDVLAADSGEPPLLLLDDVFSELDPERRAHLVRRIAALPQAVVTTTSLADLDPALVAAATAWQVTPGRLERVAAPSVRR